MKNYLKKFLGIALIATMSLALLTACKKDTKPTDGGTGTTPAPTAQPNGGDDNGGDDVTPEPEVIRDLGGQEIIIGNWWEADTPAPPKTQLEEDTLAYREDIMEKHNFTVRTKRLAGWGEFKELMMISTMSGTPAADIFVMDPSFIASPLQQGLLYDLGSLDSFDFSEEKWHPEVIDMMTVNGKIYGMKAGRLEPRLGLFFNKRLLEEAGIDPEEPYNLQASGDWTWEKFEDMLKRTTRDTNNDGTPDTYGMASFNVDYYKAAVYSNNAEFIGKDENGKFFNAAVSANSLEALNWARSMYDLGYTMPQPEGSNWDWFIAAFRDSNVAFTAAEQYKVGTWEEMSDDWGFVFFPKGPQGDYTTVFNENVVVMPVGVEKARAEDVAFVYDLYTNDTPGHEDTDWRTNYYASFRDTRAVEETLTMFYEPGRGKMNYMNLVDGVKLGDDITYGLDGISASSTPAEQLDKVADLWQQFIDQTNGL